MCCETNHPTQYCAGTFKPAAYRPHQHQCDCGCLGGPNSILDLDRYREHLKAELKHVESRISKMEPERR